MTFHGWLIWTCVWNCSWPSFKNQVPICSCQNLNRIRSIPADGRGYFQRGLRWMACSVSSPWDLQHSWTCVNICRPNMKSQTEDFIKSVICCHLAACLWLQKSCHTIFSQKVTSRLRSIWRKIIFLCNISLNSCKDVVPSEWPKLPVWAPRNSCSARADPPTVLVPATMGIYSPLLFSSFFSWFPIQPLAKCTL